MTEARIVNLFMPKHGFTMEEGTLLAWTVAEGASIERGHVVAEVETEKATVEVEAPATGILRRIVAGVGDTLPVGGMLGVIADAAADDADIDAFVAHFHATFVPPEKSEF